MVSDLLFKTNGTGFGFGGFFLSFTVLIKIFALKRN